MVTTEAAWVTAFLDRVERMVILEDVSAQSPPVELFSVQGPDASSTLAGLVELPSLDVGTGEIAGVDVTLLRSRRTPMGGWDVVAPPCSAAGEALREVAAPISEAEWRAAEIEAGVPRAGIDTDAKTLPPELGPAFEEAHVSYTKGCYVGQEVLMRLHSRGHTNRTWRGLLAEAPITRGAVVEHAARKDAGQITSACVSRLCGPIGLAMLRKEAASLGDRVWVRLDGSVVEAEVVELPFS